MRRRPFRLTRYHGMQTGAGPQQRRHTRRYNELHYLINQLGACVRLLPRLSVRPSKQHQLLDEALAQLRQQLAVVAQAAHIDAIQREVKRLQIAERRQRQHEDGVDDYLQRSA